MCTQTPLFIFVFLPIAAFISAVFLWGELVILSPAAVQVYLIAQEPGRINQVLTLVSHRTGVLLLHAHPVHKSPKFQNNFDSLG